MESTHSATPPAPRPDVARTDLTRPSWFNGESRNTDLLWLDKNENLDPVLLKFTQEVLSQIDPKSLCTYPENTPLYKKLANSLDLPPEHLILTPGSDGAIRSVFEAFISPGDVVLHSSPTFAMYAVYSKMYGAREFALEYNASEKGPVLTLEEILHAIQTRRPKLFCLPNPDSPTGTVKSPDQMKKIVNACREVGALVLVDEAYFPFYPETVLPWVKEFDHLIVARTFAKAWGLAGLRIGYAAASRRVAALLHKVRPMYEVNTFAVAFMEKMLDHSEEMEASVARLKAGKNYFLGEMNKLGLKTLNGEGNFLHVAFGSHAEKVFHALESKVLFRKDFTEPCLKGFSRFSATTEEAFKPIVKTIQGALS